MNALFSQIKWQFLIYRRNNLLTMIAGINAFYVLIVYLIKDFAGIEKFITLLIYNDPALIGFIFIGITIILEKDQELLPALFATPVNLHVYLISRIAALSLLGLIGALAIILTAKGTSFNFLHFAVGSFSTCVLFSLMGILVVSYTTEILRFLLLALPLLIFMSLPLLNYYELTDLIFLKILPVQGGLNLTVNSYSASPDIREILFGYFSILVWTPLLYWFVSKVFRAKVVKI